MYTFKISRYVICEEVALIFYLPYVSKDICVVFSRFSLNCRMKDI